jgi:7,8-dihydro-6-hydroxymethylpterin dimethyltransferase
MAEFPAAPGAATEALCPQCLRVLPARRERRGDAVWLTRTCPEHGAAEAVIWRGAPDFASWRRAKTPSAPPVPQTKVRHGCPRDCGLCPEHGQHTCTAVVEVTQGCDLRCPVCYAASGHDAGPDEPAGALFERLARLRREAGPVNVQLSGGEPTRRADLPELLRAARGLGFGLVQLNTNGLRLGREPGYARKLAAAGLQSVFLQFDGPDAACRILRGRPLLADKLRALDACAAAGLGVVLVVTLLRGANDRALGGILRLAVERAPVVRGLHLQPAAAFGRFPGALGDGLRITLPEALTLLVEQSGGLLRVEDFQPPCCEHERCSFSARFAVRAGKLVPLRDGGCCEPGPLFAPLPAGEGARRAKAVVAAQWAGAAAPPAGVPRDDFERFLAGAPARLSISCMAFQDADTLELERVRGCCIHVQARDGRLIPFCLYNLTGRDGRALYREGAA